MKLKLYTLSLIIPLLLPGCVENIISINIHPDGKSYFKFHSRGDSLDIFDNDFTHPTKTLYNRPQKELKEEGSNNWFQTTLKQLNDWGCKFTELRMGKPAYDLFIDDKNINSEVFFH